MNLSQTQALLVFIMNTDNRKRPDDGVVAAWQSILKDVAPGDATEAARRHFRDKPDVYLMPGHIVAGAEEVAKETQRAAIEAKERAEEAFYADLYPTPGPKKVVPMPQWFREEMAKLFKLPPDVSMTRKQAFRRDPKWIAWQESRPPVGRPAPDTTSTTRDQP